MKKTTKLLTSVLLASSMVLGLAACGGETSGDSDAAGGDSSGQADKVYEIKLGHVLATTHPVHVALSEASDNIKEKTDGAVELQIYPNGELSSYDDGVEAVRSGAPYIFFSSPGQLSDYVPNMSALQAPFLYSSFAEYSSIMDSDVIANLKAEAEAEGIKVLSLNFVSGFRHILADKPVVSVADAENLQMRTPSNAVFIDPMEAIGVVTSSINWNETYTALQNGTVDSIEGTVGNIYDAKMYENKTEISKTAHVIDMSGLFISLDYWNALPAEYQTIIQDEITAAEAVQNAAAEQIEIDYVKLLEDEGVTFHEVNKQEFIDATAHLVEAYEIGAELQAAVEAAKAE